MRILRTIFTRRVRAALYGAGIAADAALIASGDFPGWTAAVAAPLLLAILNLTPAEVEPDDEP